MEKGIELRTVIDDLRLELLGLTRTVENEKLQFVVESVELELKVGVTKTAGADATAKFWVLELGAKGEYKNEETQTVKLKLKPQLRNAKTGTSQEVAVSDGTQRGQVTED